MTKHAARCLTHRRIPIGPEAKCCLCNGTDRLHRHHPNILNDPLRVDIVCIHCHPELDRRDGTRSRVKPANCLVCGVGFQPKRSRRAALCGNPACAVEHGRRNAIRRWVKESK